MISDAHPGNFIKTDKGLVPIDVDITPGRRMPKKMALNQSNVLTVNQSHCSNGKPTLGDIVRWTRNEVTGNMPDKPQGPQQPFHSERAWRSHHDIKRDLIAAGDELSRHPLCMPGYGSIDIKNNGSGEVWYTGGDSDGEGFREVVIKRLMRVEGVTKVTYRQEVPPDRESEVYGGGAPLWDECWVADGRQSGHGLPTLEDLL